MNVVVATDLSDHSLSALRWAAAYALQHIADLYVIHVVDNVGDDELWSVLFETPRDLESRLLEQLTEQTKAFVTTHVPKVPVAGVRVVVGQPASEIARYADDVEASLVISGTSGQGRIKRAILGSTAFRLPHATTVPMAFIPGDATPPPIEHAVVAVDLSATTPHVLRWVADHLDGIELTVVHSAGLTNLAATIGPTPDFVSTLRSLTAQRVDQITELLAEYDLTATVLVEQDAASTAILDIARARGADLIVMGSRGLGAFERFMLGSVTQQVVRETTIPVIAIRD